MSSTRDQIIAITCDLLEAQGYHATGLNQIIRESGAPKGSLYYYFPDGKEELTAAAIERNGKLLEERIRANLDQTSDAAQAISRFIEALAYHVEASGFRAGGPLMTVAMETAISSERLNLACRAAYDRLLQAFADRLAASEFPPAQAAALAVFIISAIEGGIVLSRTQHSGDPLRQVAAEMSWVLAAARAR